MELLAKARWTLSPGFKPRPRIVNRGLRLLAPLFLSVVRQQAGPKLLNIDPLEFAQESFLKLLPQEMAGFSLSFNRGFKESFRKNRLTGGDWRQKILQGHQG